MSNETKTDPLNDWVRKIGTSLSDEDYEAGIRAVTTHDAQVAARALRIVESVCMDTDGDHLDGESEIPVGEVMRMILEAERVFGIEREAGEADE